jgi:hypothetical protein
MPAAHRPRRGAARRRTTLLAAAGAAWLATAPGGAAAHPLPAAAHDSEATRALAREIARFREALREAVGRKDAARLRALYAESFTHTHGSGRMDGRDARIVSALAGDPLIETAPAEELNLRLFGDATAILTGRSPILNLQENRAYDFRWIAVYVRTEQGWQLAASQATRLPAPPAASPAAATR